MPSWAQARDIYLFKALYYGREVDGLDVSESGGSGLRELERNRVEYSRKQGYCYLHFSCRSAERLGGGKEALGETSEQDCVLPHYWRYLAIWKLFTSSRLRVATGEVIDSGSIDWVLYMDLDAMFTNYQVRVEQIIERYAMGSTSLIVSADTKCYDERYPINNGIMIFKNSLFSIQLAFQILIKQRQFALQFSKSMERQRKDNLLWHWRSGDWIAHLSGLTPMASSLRKKFIKQVCDSSPDEVCPFTISIDNKELVEVENKLSLIRYKKEQKLLNPGGPKKTAKKSKKKAKPGPQKKSGDPLSIRVSLNLSNLESAQSNELRESSSDDTNQVSKNKEFSVLQVSQQGSGGAELQGEKDSKGFLDPPISEESGSISSKETTSQSDLLDPVSGSQTETGSILKAVTTLDSDSNIPMEVPSIGGSIEITLESVRGQNLGFPEDVEIAEQPVSPAESSG
ncbi:hypothetical protein OIY81_2875 [Cryptosporidium canis]|nr:hypothetical protein OIY81_2875 [Cryptosporidium canis]